MDWNLKRMLPTAAASLVAFTSLVNADENAQMRNLENRVSALEQRKGSNGMINPPARPEVKDGYNFFVTADLLYWNYHVDGVPYCIESRSTAGNRIVDGTVENAHFDWDWGFKVGLGYNMAHDGWDVYLNWTRFHPEKSRRAESAPSGGAMGTLFTTQVAPDGTGSVAAPEVVNHADVSYRMRMDLVDLELGREFFVSKHLTLRPFVGLRYARIDQKLDVDYKGGETLGATRKWEIDLKNNFWGLGLRTGLNSQWGFGGGWSIYGDIGISLLYGVFHIDNDQEDEPVLSGLGTDVIDVGNSWRTTKAVTDLALGLRWDHLFDGDRYAIGIQAGWEHHMFFEQNQMMRFVDDVYMGQFVANQGDLSTQGWTLEVRFDF
jgi:hypothetical protein